MAFATINPDFTLNIPAIQDQFDEFVQLTGVKKILSIGGWSFSTDPSTYVSPKTLLVLKPTSKILFKSRGFAYVLALLRRMVTNILI